MKICGQLTCFLRKYCSNAGEMKYLNVAEKPDAAKNISRLLSNGAATRREGFSVYNKIFEFNANVKGKQVKMLMTSVSGHLMNYAFSGHYKGWNNCDPLLLFDAPLKKICKEDSDKIKRTLEREIKSCQALIIWTDCDREGENIGFEIIDVCRAVKPNIQVYRAKFSEITSVAVKRALANISEPDIRLSQAVDVRMELDLRTGAAFTRYLTLRLKRIFPIHIADKLISYGSCQFPTMGFVAARYKEAEAFVSEPFWKIKVTHTLNDLTVEFNWARNRLFNRESCEDYLLLCLENPKATVESVVTKPKNKWRPTPMDTVELEKLGSRKLKLTAKRVMTIAEKLYTQGIISYPRTETNIFSGDINLRSLVEMQADHPTWGSFVPRVLEWGPNPRNGKKSDQAHPPIHPTKLTLDLNGDEQRVYELIVRHFLACVSKDAVGSETVVNIDIAGEKFSASGLVIHERNYLDVYIYEKWNAKEIHKYENGQVFDPTDISMQEGSTSAPPLLTEADLIVLMEKHGIGTDATHAEHIDTVKERGYIGEIERGFLAPGTIGMGLYEGSEAMEISLAQPGLRAEFESDLKKICTGEKDPRQVLQEQIIKYKEAYKKVTEKVRALDEKIAQRLNETPHEIAENEIEETRCPQVFKCPKCNTSPMTLRRLENENFLIGCLGFPDCKNGIWLRDGIRDVTISDSSCSSCGSDFKKLNVKFKQSSYLAMLNSSSNVYVTCLGCDSNFRNLFQINLESVKRVGSIVADNSSERSRTANTRYRQAASSNTNNSNHENVNIRSFSTTTSSNNRQVSDEQNLNALFEDDDGFDAFVVNSGTEPQASVPSEQISNVVHETWRTSSTGLQNNRQIDGSSNQRSSNTNNWNRSCPQATTNINNRIDSGSGSRRWNSTNIDITNNQQSSWSTSSSRSALETNNRPQTSSGAWPQNSYGEDRSRSNNTEELINRWGVANTPPMERIASIKCSGCRKAAKELVVKKDGPNKGRVFYSCPKPNPCTFFQWADDVTPQGNSNHQRGRNSSLQDILCSGCNIPSKELVVKKDGPNKGRVFYTCANGSSCGFFQWANENEAPNTNGPRPSTSWGGGQRRDQSADNNEPLPKKRKCGLCRQEGHTKKKCPRNFQS